MYIGTIKSKRMFAGPGSFARIAEAEVITDADEVVFVTVQEYDGSEYTVSEKSVYAFLAEDSGEAVEAFLEEYTNAADTKASAYAKVFDQMRKVLKMLG